MFLLFWHLILAINACEDKSSEGPKRVRTKGKVVLVLSQHLVPQHSIKSF